MRRYFRPWLADLAHDKSEELNAGKDPDWNAAADPAWLADNSAAVWVENLACGANPRPHRCAGSTEPGGRNSRVMIARFPGITPHTTKPPAPVADTVPRGTTSATPPIGPGTYTLDGTVSGSATVTITMRLPDTTISVSYTSVSNQKGYVIDGTESVTATAAARWTRRSGVPERATRFRHARFTSAFNHPDTTMVNDLFWGHGGGLLWLFGRNQRVLRRGHQMVDLQPHLVNRKAQRQHSARRFATTRGLPAASKVVQIGSHVV